MIACDHYTIEKSAVSGSQAGAFRACEKREVLRTSGLLPNDNSFAVVIIPYDHTKNQSILFRQGKICVEDCQNSISYYFKCSFELFRQDNFPLFSIEPLAIAIFLW